MEAIMVEFPLTCPEHFNTRFTILFVVATKEKKGSIPLPLQTLGKILVPGEIAAFGSVEHENREGLPTIYN